MDTKSFEAPRAKPREYSYSAVFHKVYLNWRNKPANLEKYPFGMLMPGFADILGLELAGIDQPSGEIEKDKGRSWLRGHARKKTMATYLLRWRLREG